MADTIEKQDISKIEDQPPVPESNLKELVIAATAGSVIEWYDFFIFGSLATTLASKFYKTGTPNGDLIAWLATYAVGFIARPIGAAVFGVMGDKMGRKATFLLTLGMMGVGTTLVGALPTYAEIGPWAGYLLVVLRIIQGLSIGGEFGGASLYIAEYSPPDRRGYYTSWINTSASFGLILSFGVILALTFGLGEKIFLEWGWRIAFLISALLIVLSVYIRTKLKESPIFERAKNNPNLAKKKSYLSSFTTKKNLYYICVALFGNSIGQGISFYVSTFYALFFLQAVLFVPRTASFVIVMAATGIVWPVTVLSGHLSDKYGRRPFMILGLALSLCAWYPVYYGMYQYGPFVNPTVQAALRVPNPSYSPVMIGLLLTVLGLGPGISFGPFPAHLVELFPTSVRYTSLSVPYTIGSGVFGGLVPVVGLSMVTSYGNVFAGLWYPFIATGITFVFLLMLVPETNHVDIEQDEELEKTWFLKKLGF